MEIQQTEDWLPPDTSHLMFRDCDIVAQWGLGYFTSADVPVQATINLVVDGLGEYWSSNNITKPDNFTELLPWAMTSGGEPLYIQTLNYTYRECRTQFCRTLPWEGNADLAGRGMVANYFIQAALVTIYLTFHMAARFGWTPSPHTIAHKTLVAIQESTRPFLDTALLFSFSVHLASLFSFIRGRIYDDYPTPTTAAALSAFISLYTIFPPLALHAMDTANLRRKQGRVQLWMFLGALKLTVGALYYGDPQSPWLREWQDWSDLATYQTHNQTGLFGLLQNDDDHQLKWESFCVTEVGAEQANWAITVTSAICSTCVVVYVLVVHNIFGLNFLKDERSALLRKFRHIRWTLVAFLAFQAMWVCLGIFIWFRAEMNKHAGNLNKDRQWTFGQILAVTTWAPVLFEFYTIWKLGAEKGLTGTLSRRYAVKKIEDVQEEKVDQERPQTTNGEQTSDHDGKPKHSNANIP